MKIKKKLLFGLFCMLLSITWANAQFVWAKIGVNGLTCSQCTRSVEMSIRKLDFVQDVKMSLKNTEGEITFKQGTKVDMEKIAQAVLSAGFSVRFVKAGLKLYNVQISEGYCYSYENVYYQFVGVTNKKLNGETTLVFLGEKYQPKSEFNIVKKKLQTNCDAPAKKTFFVTI